MNNLVMFYTGFTVAFLAILWVWRVEHLRKHYRVRLAALHEVTVVVIDEASKSIVDGQSWTDTLIYTPGYSWDLKVDYRNLLFVMDTLEEKGRLSPEVSIRLRRRLHDVFENAPVQRTIKRSDTMLD